VWKSLYATLVCACVLALRSSVPAELNRPASQLSSESASGKPQKTIPSKTTPPQPHSASQQVVDAPMATEERLGLPGWWPTKPFATRQDFVGTAECARCHSRKAATQLTTPMAQASSPAVDSTILREHNVVSRKLGSHTYSITHGLSGIEYSVGDGTNTISEPLTWAFGLGNKGQTYIFRHDGSFYESRMSFYKALQGLDLTTGHAATSPPTLEDALGRKLDAATVRRCFGCHTTASSNSSGFDPSRLMLGVTCEGCHGPGAKHVALMGQKKFAEGRLAIFNPSSLKPVAQVDFCGACHRTGNDVYEMGATGMSNVRFQPYRLENSRCWRDGDARLTCVACHDPHEPLVHEAAAYDQKCLACHVLSPKQLSRDHPGKRCPVGKKNCVSCHMPRVDVPQMHAPFVDHRIRIVRKGSDYPE
jgi:hypothetical protein